MVFRSRMTERRSEMRAVSVLAGISLVVLIVAKAAQPITAAGTPVANIAYTSVSTDEKGDPVNGRKVFLRENCYGCHGGRAGGGMCPSLRDDRPDEGDVEDAVLNGRPQGMPSFRTRVTAREILDLAAYFDSLRSPQEPTFTHWWEPGTPTQ
jgi:cytochrome c551